MSSKPKILLVGNFLPDGQESMIRYADMLLQLLQVQNYSVKLVRPKPCLIRLAPQRLRNWLGYIDKFLLFLPELIIQSLRYDVVHICDHSNAIYLQFLPHRPKLITCHDLLAVRAALGENTYCQVSKAGRWLQKAILSSLAKADLIACDSRATQDDARRLLEHFKSENIRLVQLALNYPYRRLSRDECQRRLQAIAGLDTTKPLLLSVGDSQPRKNRDGILRIFKSVSSKLNSTMVFAGQALTPELKDLAKQLGVADSIVEVVKPSNELLEALYNRAFCLIFPSFSEGFGWPILEAQACACPVVASDIEPLKSLAGGAALLRLPEDRDGFVEDILSLSNEETRERLIKQGIANLERFAPAVMTAAYTGLYCELNS